MVAALLPEFGNSELFDGYLDEIANVLFASACAIAAMLQMITEIVYPNFDPMRSINHPKQNNPIAYAAENAMTILL